MALGRIWVRLLLVNVVVVLVPVAGLEFARIYEHQLLNALERDMYNQASLTRTWLEQEIEHGVPLDDRHHAEMLERAAAKTRTRIRVIHASREIVVDSHDKGPPEGTEPEPPRLFRRAAASYTESAASMRGGSPWPEVADRQEVSRALSGSEATYTRVAHRPKAVFLFSAVPIFRLAADGSRTVEGVVYVTRSTLPVLVELYRVRSGLFKVLAVALALSVGVTLLLALSISRPLTRLSRAARRIATGERHVALPVGGSGEIRDLSESFKTMTERLDERLTYISDFAADIAHEFKTPLTSIRGAAELLAEGAHDDPDARQRFLSNILLDTERLDRLVTRLLLLSRIEASAEEMTLVDLRSAIERAVARARERGSVELTYSAQRTWVRGREHDLETALSNLLENAQRYSPPGVAVSVAARYAHGGVTIAVTDQGPGIPEGRRHKIFDRFFTTDGDRAGTGLGLAIVESVVKAHGGQVHLDTEIDRGSTFSIWLPLAP